MLQIRLLTLADVAFGMQLKEAAGWNQTRADWLRFLDLEADGCFVAERCGEPVGTTTTCVFENVGWIAMVLVDLRFRRQGIGAALMQHALNYLDERGVTTVRLDATPLGQPVYEKLGFVPEYQLARYEGVLPAHDPVEGVLTAAEEDLCELVDFDYQATGTRRARLLRYLYSQCPESFFTYHGNHGDASFLAARPGSRAFQIGPAIAEGAGGQRLLAAAGHYLHGRPVFIDIPVENQAGTSLAESLGLTVQRHLMRMRRGPGLVEKISNLWASSGPEMG